MNNDQYFLKRAIEIGKGGKAKGISPYEYGAVVVKDGQIIAEACAHVHETNDPTAHAETSAIKAAAQKLGNHHIQGCTLYGSHEPCLMCFACAVWARMDRVVFAAPASEEDSSTYGFDGVELLDLASKVTRPIKVERIELDD